MKNLKWICVLILFFTILQSYIINSKKYNYITNKYFLNGQVITEDKKTRKNIIKDKKLIYIFKNNPPKNLLEMGIMLQILLFIININLKLKNDLNFKEKNFSYN